MELKEEKNEITTLLPEEDSTNKIEINPKSPQNGRQSLEGEHYEKTELLVIKTPSSSLKDIRRRSSTLWDLQKPKVLEGKEIFAYKRRWIMLTIFVLHAIAISFQWSMYSIIANIVTKYYNVSNLSVDFTIMSFYIGYLVGFMPAGWCLSTLGLRWAVIIGAVGNCVGCFLRIFSVPADRFWLTMIGQCIVAFFQAFLPIVPARLAAVWFPAKEVSLACSIGFNGVLVGNAIGFLLPPIIVRNSENMEQIASDLNWLYIGLVVASFVNLVLVIGLLQEAPPIPPSPAQRIQRMTNESKAEESSSAKEFADSVKRLLKKRTFNLLLISFAMNVGVFCAISGLLNQVLIPHFPGMEQEVGAVGLILIVSGLFSSTLCGYILDHTHAFKATTMVLYVLSLVGWIAFILLIHGGNMTWVYIATAVLGSATSGVQPVGIEYSVEITFPEPEGSSSGLLIGSVQITGVLFTLMYGYMVEAWGDVLSNWIMAIPFGIACLCLFVMKERLKRQAAQQQKSPQHI